MRTRSQRLLDLQEDLIAELLSYATVQELYMVLRCSKACRRHVEGAAARRARRLYHRPLPAQPMMYWGGGRESCLHGLHYLDALQAQELTSIAAGTAHSVLVRPADGQVFACGSSEEVDEDEHHELHLAVLAGAQADEEDIGSSSCLAQLGMGVLAGPPVLTPQPLIGLAGVLVREVAASSNHTLLLGACGGVWSCGIRFLMVRFEDDGVYESLESACGHELAAEWTVPRRIAAYCRPWEVDSDGAALRIPHHHVRICRIAASATHSLLVCDEGHVYSCGDGDDGQLGHGDFEPKRIPTAINPIFWEVVVSRERLTMHSVYGVRACQVSAHRGVSLAVTHKGALYSWGQGSPALGQGTKVYDDKWGHMRTNFGAPTRVAFPEHVRIKQAVATNNRMLAVSRDGALYTCGTHPTCLGHGSSSFGPANTEDHPLCFVPRLVATLPGKRVRAVAAGNGHNVVLTEAGEVFTFGKCRHYELGLSTADLPADMYEDLLNGLQLTTASVPTAVSALAGLLVVEVAAGENHTIVRLANGELRTFGADHYWQLGQADLEAEQTWTPGRVVLPA